MEAVISASENTLTALLKDKHFLDYVAAKEVDFKVEQVVGSSSHHHGSTAA
jgi:hypothetical protein